MPGNTNFDFLKQDKNFEGFSEQAIEAERSLQISASTCAILCRRALELAVRFVYSYDNALTIPYQNNVSTLIHERCFRDIVGNEMFLLLKYVIRLGNSSVHTNACVKRDEAVLALRNLFEFCKWINYCYSEDYEEREFDESILPDAGEKKTKPEELQELYEKLSSKDKRLETIRKENEELRNKLSQIRLDNIESERHFEVDKLSEFETRKHYIDLDLKEAGWKIGEDCREEVEVHGMPNATGIGYVDYVLYGNNGLPLGVVEAKKASVDTKVGSHQAKLYADCLENQYGQRPLIFTTNGFETRFTDDKGGYAERSVSGVFSKEELQLNIDRRKIRRKLENIEINDKITNRPYQKEAILAVCDAISKKHRKMLVVQATGSGKTRVSISIVDVLMRHNIVKNVLFLADRTTLVKQAKNNFNNHLPGVSLCNLLDSKDNPEQSRMIFSTYQTMMNAIDSTKTKFGKKLFTPAHFDLIIVDESHRSIYKKYQDIFNYFDAMLLGLTATPKNEIDKNTYGVFDLERGNPTFSYELDQAVSEGYLVDYGTIEVKSKIMENGIHYDELSEEDKEEFENTFEDDEDVADFISSNAINEWLFNTDTIDMVLDKLMERGLRVEGNEKLGKTIIFAKNSRHAATIVERFHKRYPEYGEDYIKQIDYSIKYVDALIDDFSTKEKYPQIAVSVDMLDTGVDIPEILNLVFFKKVRSYSKFWQMIGRGTRLCPNLFGDGVDKERFLILDFCGNFDFFRADIHGIETGIVETLSEKLFNLKTQIIRELQNDVNEDEKEYRKELIKEQLQEVRGLNDDSFRVKLHYRYVEKYRADSAWCFIESKDISDLKVNIAPLIVSEDKDEYAKRFDLLIYTIDLAMLQSKNTSRPIRFIMDSAEKLKKIDLPQIKEQKYLLDKISTIEFWNNTDIVELETVREAVRDLMKYLPKKEKRIYTTSFDEEILEEKEGESLHFGNDLQNYKKRVESYLREHQDNLAVYKLKTNKKLTETDLKELEHILWTELGTKEEYKKEYGDTPIGKLVRRIVGTERAAVNEAFSEFLTEEKLNVNQLRFVNLIVDYIVVNGNVEDNTVFTMEPFKSAGSITSIFKNNLSMANRILKVVEGIRENSEGIA